jgi:DNA polymerase-4
VVADRELKSVGHEQTFARDLTSADDLGREVVRMSDAVAARLRAAGLAGRTVTLKVRFASFRTITRSLTLPEPIDHGHGIGAAARALLDQVDCDEGVRLLGVSVSNLGPPPGQQLALQGLGEEAERAGAGWDDASAAVDEIRERFGTDAIGPATLVEPTGLRLTRRGLQQWGPDAESPTPTAGPGDGSAT